MSPDIGEFIKGLRENARISLRQLADQAGVSNPYLSQIERGLRKPSAEVLAQIASALRVSTPVMYLRAGLLGTEDGPGVLSAIAADQVLTVAQKQSLTQIYETFVRENVRHESDQAGATPAETGPTAAKAAPAKGSATTAASKPSTRSEASPPKATRRAKPRTSNKPAGSATAGSKPASGKGAGNTETADDTKTAHIQEDQS